MTKAEAIINLKMMIETIDKLPAEFEVERCNFDYDGKVRIRVGAEKSDALYRYANAESLYCKTCNGEFNNYDGIHVLCENGAELYMMIRRG